MVQRNVLAIAGTLALLSFVTYAGFLQDPRNDNVASRMFLAVAIVGHGELSIDRYAHNTIDKAHWQGKFYLDKAPGLSLSALPAIGLAWWLLVDGKDVGEEPGWPPSYYALTYFANLSTSALITALSVGALFLVALSVLGNAAAALLVALAYGLATPAFGWATAFVGHASAMGLLVIGFAFMHFLRGGDARVVSRRNVLAAVALACLTWACVIEFTAAPVAAMIVVYGLWSAARDRSRWPQLAACLLAGLVFMLPLLAYNTLAFGAPWRLGYQAVQGFPGMDQGLFGIAMPRLSVLYEITLGARRGILHVAPVLVLVPLGLFQMCSREDQRGTALLVTLVVGYYLALNSSYYYWDGGWSTGPRHITGMLPFACIALGSVWCRASRGMRGVVVVLLSASLALTLMSVAAGMLIPGGEGLVDYVVSEFVSLGTSTAVPVTLFGWRSRYVLLTLLAVWAVAALVLARQFRGLDRETAGSTAGTLGGRVSKSRGVEDGMV